MYNMHNLLKGDGEARAKLKHIDWGADGAHAWTTEICDTVDSAFEQHKQGGVQKHWQMRRQIQRKLSSGYEGQKGAKDTLEEHMCKTQKCRRFSILAYF